MGCCRKIGNNLRNPTLPINLKKKWVLPVLTYGMETMTLTVKSANRLGTTQSKELCWRVSLRDHIQNEEIRKRTPKSTML